MTKVNHGPSFEVYLSITLNLFHMMRRFLSILLLFSYFDTAFAVGIDVHFCGGQMVDVKLIALGQAKCDWPENNMSKNCCGNEFRFCKTDNHKRQIVIVVLAPEAPIKVLFLFSDYISPLTVVRIEKANSQIDNYNRLKFRYTWPLFILNEIYRI